MSAKITWGTTPPTINCLQKKESVSLVTSSATTRLQLVKLSNTNLIKSFKDVDESKICRLNAYYAMYGATHLVEKLAWSADQILSTCEDSFCDKVREGLVGMSEL